MSNGVVLVEKGSFVKKKYMSTVEKIVSDRRSVSKNEDRQEKIEFGAPLRGSLQV